MKKIRIGSGAGYGGDRIEPAIDLMERGNLDYIIFECLAERTIALAQLEKKENPEKGYNPLFEYRMDRILDARKKNPIKVITNMGAANPAAAAKKACRMAKEKGITGLKIAAVTGDDVLEKMEAHQDDLIMETGEPLRSISDQVISANAYIGVKGIVEALGQGADIVITGRVADPSLSLAALVYEFGWKMDDYDRLGKGTIIGHLLECAGQVTGGYFCDPGYKDVEELWNLGFPIIEATEDGEFFVTKLDGTGGTVNEMTCKEQIIYEIQDPAKYDTPDCTADFSQVAVRQEAKDKVRVTGVTGTENNGKYKVSVGYQDGYIGEGQISYGGETALERAELAEEIIRKRLAVTGCEYEELRIDMLGVNSLYGKAISKHIAENNANSPAVQRPIEVRLRVAARTKDRANAEKIGNEVEALYVCGPAGGGGAVKSVREIVSVASILIPKTEVTVKVLVKEV